MKYIIEIAKEYEEYFKGILICGIADGKFAVDVIAREDLEELTSDYINEHFGDLQDTAYQKGLHDGESKCRYCNEYQRGLDDGKAQDGHGCEGCEWDGTPFDVCSKCRNSYGNLYKRKEPHDEIKVGDEVSAEDGTSIFIVTWMSERCLCGVDKEGRCYSYEWGEICGKTGNHYDIVFEEMRE
jgi:hypothetical protein